MKIDALKLEIHDDANSTRPAFGQQFRAPHQRARGVGILQTKSVGARTAIDQLRQEGCSKLRIPKQIASPDLEAVMINSSGGLTGGDSIKWQFGTQSKNCLTITTQACERVYRSSGGEATIAVQLNLAEASRLNWLPQETILFDGGQLRRSMTVNMAKDARLLIVEPAIFGRTAMGEDLAEGSLSDRWQIFRDGKLIHAERIQLSGKMNELLSHKFVANGATAWATVLLVDPLAETFVSKTADLLGEYGACSAWNGRLLVRVAAPSSYVLRKILQTLLKLLNEHKNLPKMWTS